MPRSQPGAAPGLMLVQSAPPAAEAQAQEEEAGALDDLNEVLEATRAKLEELSGAAAVVAATTELREELEALGQENARLARELEQANARRAELESSSEQAEARLAELSEAVAVAAREATRNDAELVRLRRQNAQLGQSLTRVQDTQGATLADMEAKLEAATDATEQSRAEVAELRTELEAARQRLATADQSVARLSEMEKAVERSDSEAERLQTELAAVKEQLGQAAGAALEAERARQAATSEAESLRDEAERVRVELAAATGEIDRFKSANTDLEKQIASWQRDSRSAIETARRNLIVMEEKIEELNAALGVAQPEGAMPAGEPEAMRDPAADGPAEPASPAQTAAAEATGEIAAAEPSGLTRFHANIDDLNERALDSAGVDLFAEIKPVDDDVVHISTTTAWDSIPPAGQLSYLNSLLDYWVAAKGGEGPAVVRIVDQDDQVLLEKSWP